MLAADDVINDTQSLPPALEACCATIERWYVEKYSRKAAFHCLCHAAFLSFRACAIFISPPGYAV